jgi:hypothetical protein
MRRERDRRAAGGHEGPEQEPHLEQDEHLEEDHYAPSQTYMQGYQIYGVGHVHEESDVQSRVIIPWWIGLGVFTLVMMLITWIGFAVLHRQELAREAELIPSEMFRAPQVPPEPRLLPNPVDHRPQPFEPMPGPIEYREDIQHQEDRQLEALGLLDPATGLPRVPEEALRAVATQPDAAGRPTRPMPSDASGGTRVEDRLR